MICSASPIRRCSAVLLALLLTALPAAAQAPEDAANASTGGSFDGILRALDLKAKPATPPDFVRRSRPATMDYIPTSRSHPERPLKVMTPAEVEAETEQLDAARVAQQRRAGLTPPPVPLRQAKGTAGAKPKSKDR